MTARILPPDEWPKLVGTEAEQVWPSLTSTARVVVVEDGGHIVGCHLLQPVLHAECLWIHPDHRGRSSVARRLWRAVQQTAQEQFGTTWFVTGAINDDIRALLAHVGAVKLNGDHYVVPIGKQPSCQPS